MKKIAISMLIIFMVFGMVVTVNAVETEKTASVQVSVEAPTSIEVGTQTITLTINLGTFTGIEENKAIGYETVLNYNKDIVKSVTVEGLNGWTATYSKDTQRLIGEIDSAKSNTQIAKVTYQLSENLTNEDNLELTFSNFNITDDDLLDHTTTLNKLITIKEKVPEQGAGKAPEQEEQEPEPETETENKLEEETEKEPEKTPELESETEEQTTEIVIKDYTQTKLATLPKAGIKAILLPIIIIIAIIGFICIVKSKSIKLK